MRRDFPSISIVTACLNRVQTLQAAFESTRLHDWPASEHIVIDGGSVDGTLTILKATSGLTVISEPDRGLYDAWNKGVAMAKGDVVMLLNSDDRLRGGALATVAAAFRADPELDLVCGGAEVWDDGIAVLASYRAAAAIALTPRTVTQGVPLINAKAFRTAFLRELGPFDLRYRLAADRELLLRALLRQPRTALVEAVLYDYLAHEGSLTLGKNSPHWAAVKREHIDIARRYWPRRHEFPGLARELRVWHASEVIKLAMRSLADGNPAQAARLLGPALRVDPFFAPIGIARVIATRQHRAAP